ncbi:hypothetical protein GE09DRAFT_1151758 [Coniochaeta sp. 2T2.1]|nr:hypothetical protein GE09DRAFT_1151758 [Coniochaeta sp. 2T2.1]
MYHHFRHLGITIACVLTVVLLLTLLPGLLNPTPPSKEDRQRDKQWISTSPYWLDRQACRWFMLCGVYHVRWDGPTRPPGNSIGDEDELRVDLRRRRSTTEVQDGSREKRPNEQAWMSKRRKTTEDGTGPRSGLGQEAKEIPDYVLKYAPLVHLYSGEHFWPSDIADFIKHIDPYTAGSMMNLTSPLDLDNMADLEEQNESAIFLTSEVNVETRPEWLHSYKNSPVPCTDVTACGETVKGPQEELTYSPLPLDKTTWWNVDKSHPIHRISDPRKVSRPTHEKRNSRRRPLAPIDPQHVIGKVAMHKPDAEGYSRAPAVLIMVDKGSGVMDAFWFFFYSYNLGQTVFDIRFGNHIGDWEHAMVRFEDGVPRALFCSEHEGGKAYLWSALEKKKVQQLRNRTEEGVEVEEESVERPVLYSAVGSHAMYADAGKHPYVLPWGLLKDVTDKGALWDPSLNTYAYFYDYEADAAGNTTDSLVPAASNPNAPTGWFHFGGPWGDELYDLADRRQWRLFGQYHYITGPLGPKFKKLDRSKVCQTDRCSIVTSIEAGRRSAWYG